MQLGSPLRCTWLNFTEEARDPREKHFLESILGKVDAVSRGNWAVLAESLSTNLSGVGSAW